MSNLYETYFARDKSLRHYTQHFLLNFIGLFYTYILIGNITFSNVILFFIASYLVDIDPTLTLFLYRTKYHSFRAEVVGYLKDFRFFKAGEVAVCRHKELNTLIIHNVIAYTFFCLLLYYLLYINAAAVWIYILIGMLSHFTFDICDDIYQLGHLKNWFWPFAGLLARTNTSHKKALVISGGGAKGAWGGGVIEYLQMAAGKEYDIYIGISTGALISCLASVGELDKLKDVYTSLNLSGIFKDNPFNNKGKIKIKNVVMALVTNKTSLGDSSPLRESIKSIFTQNNFNKLRSSGKEVIICVTSLTDKTVETKSSNDYEYDEFCEWLYASCCQPIFMNFVTINSKLYSDGGIKEYAPIQHAIEAGANEVDAIFLRPGESKELKDWKPKNLIDVALRVEQMLCASVSDNDYQKGVLLAQQKNIKLNVYHIPFEVLNSLTFDKVTMMDWWEQGYKDAEKENCLVHIDPSNLKTLTSINSNEVLYTMQS
jgi:NTE family protein